jgi:predicted negative regulator of RcsB-dependent stress response
VARQRITRKELLKEPDQFLTQSVLAFGWAKNHLRKIAYGVIGLVVLIGLIMAWTSWQRSRRQHAAVMLHEALKLIEVPAPQAKQTEPVPASDSGKAIEKLREITESYGSTPAGARAYWHLGHLYFEKGDVQAALAAYQQARDRFPRQQQLSVTLAALNVGYAQEATGVCEQAIDSYEAVQQSSFAWLHGEAYLGMGRCYEASGAKDKAIDVYNRALADGKLTGEVQQTINEQLARLQPPVNPPQVQPPTAETAPVESSTSAPHADAPPTPGASTESESAPAQQ